MIGNGLEEYFLDVGTWLISEGVNGPGRRLVIWLQGCTFACPGCFNPEFQSSQGGLHINCYDMAELIAAAPGIEGVTFSGGEPLLQAASLLPLLHWVMEKNLSVVCYSGYRFDELTALGEPSVNEFLSCCDILIDGRFDQEEKAALLWRGSRNQTVHFLSDRYLDLKDEALASAATQAELIQGSGHLATTGFMPPDLWKKLQNRLKEVQ